MEQNRLRALKKQEDNKAKADTAKRCLLPEHDKESPKKESAEPLPEERTKIVHETIKQLP